MKYRPLGSTGLLVSEIGFGSWAIGGTSEAAGTAWGWGEVPAQEAIAAVRKARDLGVNFFDTADVYGNGRSEEILGQAFSSGWEQILVATKVGNVVHDGVEDKDWSRSHIIRSCEDSLHKLRKEVIDLYQLHNPSEDEIRRGDWADTLETLQKQGKIRFFGVSIDLPEEALAFLERGIGHAIQLPYNALRLEMEEQVLPLAQKKQVGIIARVPLYYGILSGKYTADTTFAANDHRSHTLPPETMRELAPRAARLRKLASIAPGDAAAMGRWALKFILANPAVSTVIPGARNPQQAERNSVSADDENLPAAQIEAVRDAWRSDPWLKALRTPL